MSTDKSIIKGQVRIHENQFNVVQDSKTLKAEILEDKIDHATGTRNIYLDRRIHEDGEHEVDGFKIHGVYTSILSKSGPVPKPDEPENKGQGNLDF